MTPSTPQNSFPDPSGSADEPRNPLGFADVRAVGRAETPAAAPQGPQVGFVPRQVAAEAEPTGPSYRTEISFRRDRSAHLAVRAEAQPGAGGPVDPYDVGHAEAHTFDLDEVEVDAYADADLEADAAWFDEPSAEAERVPFYKREIGFGRKKEPVVRQEPAVQAGGGDAVPFYKREITFGRKKDVAVAATSPAPVPAPAPELEAFEADLEVDEAATPFYKRELSFERRRPAVAAVDAAEPWPTDEAPEPAPVHLHAVELPLAEPVVESPYEVEPVAEAVEPELVLEAAPSDLGDSSPEMTEVELTWEDTSEAGALVEDDVLALEQDEAEPAEAWHEPVEPLAVEEPVLAVYDEPVAYEEPVADETEDVFGESDLVLDLEHEVEEPVADASSDEPLADAGPEHEAVVPAAPVEGREPKARKAKKGKGGGKGRRVVGLKIGASQLSAAVVREEAGRHELLQLARQPLDVGIVVDGEVRDGARLVQALQTFFEEHDLPRTNVRIGLASNRIGVRTVEIDGIDDADRFDNAVRFKAHEVLPVAVHESVLDYRVVEERPTENGEVSKRVLLVVAPRDQVEPYVSACAQAGLKLTGVDLEALGLLRTFVDAHPIGFRGGDDTATVVVALGHESTTLLVAGGGVCDFTRVFDWGGGTLQNAIATELDVEQDEAAVILRHLSLGGRGKELDSLSEDARVRANEAIRARLTPFARELVSSLQFYQTQPDSLGIGEIVITGGTAHLSGLAEALHQMIGVDVRFGDPLGRVVALAEIPDALHARIGSTAVPIGLAIEDAPWRTVNLLPQELRQSGRRKPNVLAIAVPAVAVVAVAAMAVGFVSARGTVSDRQQELDGVRSQIAALPEPSRPTIDPALQGDQVARAQSVALVLGGRLAWEPFFRDLSRALPGNVWLEHITATAPDLAAAAPVASATPTATTVATPTLPTGVTISGYTYSQSDVALLLARLQAIPSISNVTLQNARKEQKGAEGSKVDVVSFSIIADLNGGAQ